MMTTVAIMKSRGGPTGYGRAHEDYFRLVSDEQRTNPHLTLEANRGAAWGRMTDAQKNQIYQEEADADRTREAESAARRRKEANMTRADEIHDMGTHGALAVSKAMLANGAPGLTEHEHFRVMQQNFQKNRRGNETPEQCFARQFCADTEEGRVIRRAHEMTKRMTAPVGDGAYDQIVALGDELRKADPKLTKEQAFAKVYTDPRHATLVALEKSESRARSTKAWPQVADHYREQAGIEALRDPKPAIAALRAMINEIRRETPYLSVEDAWARLASMVGA
jgi:hypothetical protein